MATAITCRDPNFQIFNSNLAIIVSTGYGLFSATGGGRDVDFPIGHPKYLPPEVVVSGPRGGAVGSDDIDMGGSFEVNNIRVDGNYLLMYLTTVPVSPP